MKKNRNLFKFLLSFVFVFSLSLALKPQEVHAYGLAYDTMYFEGGDHNTGIVWIEDGNANTLWNPTFTKGGQSYQLILKSPAGLNYGAGYPQRWGPNMYSTSRTVFLLQNCSSGGALSNAANHEDSNCNEVTGDGDGTTWTNWDRTCTSFSLNYQTLSYSGRSVSTKGALGYYDTRWGDLYTLYEPSASELSVYNVWLNANGGSCSQSVVQYRYAFNGFNGTFNNYNSWAPGYNSSYFSAGSAYTSGYSLVLNNVKGTLSVPAYTLGGGCLTTRTNQQIIVQHSRETTPLYAQYYRPAITLPIPTRTGYRFDGWYCGSSGPYTTSIPANNGLNGDFTLVAHWTPVYHTVNYNANGGWNAPGSQQKLQDSTLTLSSQIPYRNGYGFSYWTDHTGRAYNAGGAFTGNYSTTMYANWYANKLTLCYNANGGSGAMGNSAGVYGGTVQIAYPNYNRNCYHYRPGAVWNTSPNGSGTWFNQGSTYAATALNGSLTSPTSHAFTTTLYLQWVRNQYQINYNSNKPARASTNIANPNNITSTGYRDCNTNFTLPQAYSLPGYTALGWSKSSTATTASYTLGQVVNHIHASTSGCPTKTDLTLYQVWRPNTYNIRYHSNLSTDTTKVKSGYVFDNATKALTQSESGFSKTGYYIAYWTTKPDNSGKSYWNSNGTGTQAVPGAVKYSSSDSEWTSDGTIKSQVLNLTTVDNGTVDLYAHWEPIKYTLRYQPNDANGGTNPNGTAGTYSVTLLYDNPNGNFLKNLWTRTTEGGESEFIGWARQVNTTLGDPNAYTADFDDMTHIPNLTTTRNATVDIFAIFDDMPSLTFVTSSVETQGINQSIDQVNSKAQWPIVDGTSLRTNYDSFTGTELEIFLLSYGIARDREDDTRAGRIKIPNGDKYYIQYLNPDLMQVNNIPTAYDCIYIVKDSNNKQITKHATLYQGDETEIMVH